MKILEISQDSPEWLSWRRTSVTASDAAIIMGISPYCDIETLRKRKLGIIPEESCNQWMQRGKDMEQSARDYFFFSGTGLAFPAVVESSEYPFLGASLDGISKLGNYLLEIKCGKGSHKLAKKGKIPEYYNAQIQHQLICTRAEKCYYLSYQSDNDNVIIEVFPDKGWEKEYIPKAETFWMSLIFYQ